jgi:hypothetical protein
MPSNTTSAVTMGDDSRHDAIGEPLNSDEVDA